MKKIFILLLIINSMLLSQKLKISDYRPSSDGFITSWLLRGTFSIDDSHTRDFDFLKDYGTEKNIWNIDKMLKDNVIGNLETISSKWFPVNPSYYNISLQDFYNKSPFKSCYALAVIESAINQPVYIKCGSDDGVKIILNGKTIHDNNAWRGVTPDEDIVKGEFKKGLNSLLVKINNGTGDYGFCVRITSPDDQPLDNIKIKFPNNLSDDEIFKSICSSFSIYSMYDKTGSKAKFVTRITAETSFPSDYKKDLVLKLNLTDNAGKLIKEFHSETINNIGNFKSKEIAFVPENLQGGRYVIKLIITDLSGSLLSEKDDIVFWN
jgi:hypothetical protein